MDRSARRGGRLFVAAWPPEDVLDRVAAVERPVVPGLRWTTRDQWHVTLRFMGQVDEVTDVVAALRALDVAGSGAALGPGIGRFGQLVLMVPVTGLEAVAAEVVRATAHLGRPPEDRPFAGHLTLARVAKGARVDLRPLTGSPVVGAWTVTSVCLVESHLSPTGARYEVLDRFGLKDS